MTASEGVDIDKDMFADLEDFDDLDIDAVLEKTES